MRIFGLVGWSGSGKTTLMVALLPYIIGRGFRVSTMKHTSHQVDMDRPGKDSYRHRAAGATDVVLVSSGRITLVHELRGEREPTPEDILPRLLPVDLLLAEGFKRFPHDKLEVHRAALGQPLLAGADPTIVAVAADIPPAACPRPVLDLDDVAAIGDFIIAHCRLVAAGQG
jgi:molybdopterin-guanine dinucleotide biosynthesis protein B